MPASLPSARSAVRTIAPATSATGAAAAGAAGRTGCPPRRKPHEPQKRFVGPLMCPHCGPGHGWRPHGRHRSERLRGGRRRSDGRRSNRGCRLERRRWWRGDGRWRGLRKRGRAGGDVRRRRRDGLGQHGLLDPLRRRIRRERLGRGVTWELGTTPQAKLVMVLIVLRALRARDPPWASGARRARAAFAGEHEPARTRLGCDAAKAHGGEPITARAQHVFRYGSRPHVHLEASHAGSHIPADPDPWKRRPLRALRHVDGQRRHQARGGADAEDREELRRPRCRDAGVEGPQDRGKQEGGSLFRRNHLPSRHPGLHHGPGGRPSRARHRRLPGYKFADEFHPELPSRRARRPLDGELGPRDERVREFFLCEKPTPWLDNKHTVFGKAVLGADVIKKITHSQTGRPRPPGHGRSS